MDQSSLRREILCGWVFASPDGSSDACSMTFSQDKASSSHYTIVSSSTAYSRAVLMI